MTASEKQRAVRKEETITTTTNTESQYFWAHPSVARQKADSFRNVLVQGVRRNQSD